MDQSFNQKLKAGVLAFALVMMMSACSSSQVEEGAVPAESVTDLSTPPEASTDAVPASDPAMAGVVEDPNLDQQPAPESLASSGDEPPMADPALAGDPALATDPNVAMVSPVVEETPVMDPGIANVPMSENDSNAIASADTSLDLPEQDLSLEPAPISESGNNDYLADVEPAPKKKKKKSKKGSASRVARQSPRFEATGDASQYVVKRGDTLMKIAFENYGDLYRWREIFEANRDRIQDPNNVPPGTQLVLNGAGMVQIERNGEQYLIHRGETLGSISRNVYGTTHKWKKLWENNRQLIKDPNKIYAGFYLYYQPEGKLTNEPAAVEGSDSAANRPVQSVNPVAGNGVQPQTQPEMLRSPASAAQPGAQPGQPAGH